jgi:hypothetical protein
MSLFLGLDAIATTRGDGLRPELRALLMRAAAAPRAGGLGTADMSRPAPNPIFAADTDAETKPDHYAIRSR